MQFSLYEWVEQMHRKAHRRSDPTAYQFHVRSLLTNGSSRPHSADRHASCGSHQRADQVLPDGSVIAAGVDRLAGGANGSHSVVVRATQRGLGGVPERKGTGARAGAWGQRDAA